MRTTRLFLSTLLFLITMQVNAQFTITAVAPPTSAFTFDDLWHLNITGPATTTYTQYYVGLRIFNHANTELVVKSNSAIFAFSYLPLYTTHLNMGPLSPLNTLYYDYSLQSVLQSGGFFPVGVYDIQFVLLGRPNDGEFTELAEYDYQAIVEAFWPPILLSPYDQDTIDNPYPVLTWTPAFYASNASTIEYSLWLVQLNGNQDPYQGITSNPYILHIDNLPGTTQLYPPSAYQMKVGDRFAWQVAATIDNQPVAYTEVWSFVYSVDTLQDTTQEKSDVFFHLKRSGTSGELEQLYSVDKHLKFQIEEEYNVSDSIPLKFQIKDKNNDIVYKSWENDYYPLNYGTNRYVVDPCALNLDPEAPYYRLEVAGIKNEWFYTFFKFSPGFNCND